MDDLSFKIEYKLNGVIGYQTVKSDDLSNAINDLINEGVMMQDITVSPIMMQWSFTIQL